MGSLFVYIGILSHLKISVLGTQQFWIHPVTNNQITEPYFWANLPEMPNDDNDFDWTSTFKLDKLPVFEELVLLVLEGRNENFITIGYLSCIKHTINGTELFWFDELTSTSISYTRVLYWMDLPNKPLISIF